MLVTEKSSILRKCKNDKYLIGRVVEITGKTHKYKGEKAVIQFIKPKQYHVRLLRLKGVLDRLKFNDKGIFTNRATSPFYMFYISKNNVKLDGKKCMDPLTNKWQHDTIKIIKKYKGKSVSQIKKMLEKNPHKIVWKY